MDVLKPLTVPVNRFAWADYLKVFGTLCVLLGHCNLQGEAITQWIFSFHMPLFFLISGFLYKPTGLKLCFVKSLKTLLLPYVLLNAICFAYFSYFALYRPYCKGGYSRHQVFRTNYPYVIKHLPWYQDTENLTEEEKYYTSHSKKASHWTGRVR